MKKYIGLVLMVCLIFTGCANKGTLEEKGQVAPDTSKVVDENIGHEPADLDTSEASASDEDFDYMPWTLELLLEDDLDKVNQDQAQVLQGILDEINGLEKDFKADQEDDLDALYEGLEEKLVAYGLEDLLKQDESLDGDETSTSADGGDQAEPGLEPWTLEMYLGIDYGLLDEDQKMVVAKHLDEINEAEADQTQDRYDEIQDLYTALTNQLRDYGIQVPITSYKELVDLNPQAFSQDQGQALLALDEEMQALYQASLESPDLEQAYEKLEEILQEAGFDADDIIAQVETGAMNYAMFAVEGDQVIFKGDKDKVGHERLAVYRQVVDQALKVVDESHRHYLKYLVVNTDGLGNILAYVSQEDESLTKWRMVVDLKDAFDDKGAYLKTYDETLVHEYGHLLTLNSGQMQATSKGTYENEEGILSETSYLNRFYNKFWTAIKDDHAASVDADDTSGDQAYAFYEKYEDQFVSDYAATNPEEDIAETFRVFVFGQADQGQAIKDKKVAWFYDQEDLVKLRANIRENLGL